MKALIIINDPPYGFGLDDFQALNGLAGHQAGDRVLQEVARRLGGFSREPGFVSRLGGDVFGLWLTPREGKQKAHLEFKFYYQPQFDRSHCCVGYEAPLRWRHPEHGMVSPAEFIPVAEEARQLAGPSLVIPRWSSQSMAR